MIRGLVRAVDRSSTAAPLLKRALRYAFPDHWTFLLGEIAAYTFIILVATGTYLTFFFDPSLAPTVYHGPYRPLQGAGMSHAYASVLDISFRVKAGLLIRQTHHWAADVFIVAIVLHALRIFFTGAFRKPRRLIWMIGITLLALSLVEGFLGYSMVDDQLSGMGLAIAYSVVMSVPLVGGNLALLLWGGSYPGSAAFEQRMEIAHVLFIPILIAGLIGLHLLLVAARHHTQFRGPGRSERTVVGLPAVPSYAARSLGLGFGVAAVLILLGGLVQINPVWLWGPYHLANGPNGAQPDWYLGWLIGALRLVPGFDVVIGHVTLIPNPFWGGVLFPAAVFGSLTAWPWIEARLTGDRHAHNLLDRPRDAPLRTACGAAFLTVLAVVFLAGAMDRITVWLGIPYADLVRAFRAAVFVLPVIVFLITRRVCRDLLAQELDEARQEAQAALELQGSTARP
jgi:ubiquinol-cytochrome c reductase cytochrome b subunit